MKYKEGHPYYIEWWDHCNDSGNWKLDFKNNDFGPMLMKSLGWVVKDAKDHVAIAQNSEIDKDPVTCAHMVILKSCIKKHKKLTINK